MPPANGLSSGSEGGSSDDRNNAAPRQNLPAESAPPAGFASGPVNVVVSEPAKKAPKKWLVPLGAAVLVLLAGAAAYLGMVVPNQPQNVWARALENSAAGYDELIAYTRENKDTKGADFKGTFKADGSFKTDGSFEGSTFEDNATFKLDVGLGVTRANLETRLIKSQSNNPDVYINVKGLKGLEQLAGESGVSTIINNIEGQWVYIDHTLLDNVEKRIGNAQSQQPSASELKPEDVSDIMSKAGEALDAHIFTDDPTKAVLSVREFIGKEERDGRTMYHYKLNIDKARLKDFVTAFKDKMKETKLPALLQGRSIEQAMNYDRLIKEIDAMETDKTVVDAWVDANTKLIHALRFSDQRNEGNFVEFGTPYTGGDEVPLLIRVSSRENSGAVSATIRTVVNKKTDVLKLSAETTSAQNGNETTFRLELDASPRNEALAVEKPAAAKPLLESLGDLGPFLEQMFNDDPVINDGPITPGNPRINIR